MGFAGLGLVDLDIHQGNGELSSFLLSLLMLAVQRMRATGSPECRRLNALDECPGGCFLWSRTSRGRGQVDAQVPGRLQPKEVPARRCVRDNLDAGLIRAGEEGGQGEEGAEAHLRPGSVDSIPSRAFSVLFYHVYAVPP